MKTKISALTVKLTLMTLACLMTACGGKDDDKPAMKSVEGGSPSSCRFLDDRQQEFACMKITYSGMVPADYYIIPSRLDAIVQDDCNNGRIERGFRGVNLIVSTQFSNHLPCVDSGTAVGYCVYEINSPQGVRIRKTIQVTDPIMRSNLEVLCTASRTGGRWLSPAQFQALSQY